MHDFHLKNMRLEENKDKAVRYSIWISEKIEKAMRAQSKMTDGRVSTSVILIDCKGVTDVLKSLGWTKLPLSTYAFAKMNTTIIF